jgi:outer membrane scaffolding protein for murein synthesis (MipA/OmpV family)
MNHGGRAAVVIAMAMLAGTGRSGAEAVDEAIGSTNLPLWEVGIFAGAASLPHYRGSDQSRAYVLPVPYLIYRGRFLRSDREGVRGLVLRTDHVETAVSLSGSPPVGDDNRAREGMPELGPTVEVGPALKWFPFGRMEDQRFYLVASGRAAMASEPEDWYRLDSLGWRASLAAVYAIEEPFDWAKWRTGCTLGVDWAGDRYHDYYYRVDEAYARPGRPAFDSGSGYGGLAATAFVMREVTPRLSVGAYVRWDHLGGAEFRESPLVRREDTFMVGGAVIWTIAESSRRAPR